MSSSYRASSKSPVVIYKNGGFALTPPKKNNRVMQNIVDNTDKLAKLLSESNKSKQTNSSKKTLI